MCSATSTAKGCLLIAPDPLPPEEDARAILRLALQEFAVKARYSPEESPLSSSRVELLAQIRQLREGLESLLEGADRPASGNS